MRTISRREFLKDAATGAAALGILSAGTPELRANPLGLPIGCQTWPVRAMIAKDFPGTIRTLADAGFQSIELCSPVGYPDFRVLNKYTGPQLQSLFRQIGVTCISSHFGIKELRDDLPSRIAWAQDVGLKQMFVPSLNGPSHPTMDDVKRLADEFNEIAAKVAKAGIQQGLHNEGFEESMVDGKRTYDVLFGLLDPTLVKFQFQVSTIARGFVAAHYFRKYPGRFISMHVQGWNAKTKQIVAVGQGTLNWKDIFSAAKIGGIKNYYVEMDLPLMKASVPYLRHLKV
jgi:sugar phosphate isomerase/epimerase